MEDSLDWKKEKEQAQALIQEGKKILFHLDLGLFSALRLPLDEHTQCLSLGLALKHFVQTLWQVYSRDCLGVSLYLGPFPFSREIFLSPPLDVQFQEWFEEKEGVSKQWALELFCRNVALNYLNRIAENASADVPLWILFEEMKEGLRKSLSPAKKAVLLSNEGTHVFKVALLEALGKKEEKARVALCLPPLSECSNHCIGQMDHALEILSGKRKPFRFVSLENLISEWEELDDLIVPISALSFIELRKLQGFCAAGGRVIHLEEPLSLPQEISFSDWKKELG